MKIIQKRTCRLVTEVVIEPGKIEKVEKESREDESVTYVIEVDGRDQKRDLAKHLMDAGFQHGASRDFSMFYKGDRNWVELRQRNTSKRFTRLYLHAMEWVRQQRLEL